jgi:DNA-directed RNA polymerase subunit M
MLLERTSSGTVLRCDVCGYTEKASWVNEHRAREEQRAEIPVVEGPEAALPTAKVECPRCGNDRAYWWMRQTRSADEPTTRFYKCTKCKKVWREYA